MARDSLGNHVGGADGPTRKGCAEVVDQFHGLRGDPLSTLEPLLVERPGFAMGHLPHAWLPLLSTEPEAPASAWAHHALVIHGQRPAVTVDLIDGATLGARRAQADACGQPYAPLDQAAPPAP